ncbi:hypothetical protein DFH09DRAFT_1318836 [Mycena vulgaris]|nr:hypothetical protein DFH09DRAFT_1318836 [Mycena vulgaris]
MRANLHFSKATHPFGVRTQCEVQTHMQPKPQSSGDPKSHSVPVFVKTRNGTAPVIHTLKLARDSHTASIRCATPADATPNGTATRANTTVATDFYQRSKAGYRACAFPGDCGGVSLSFFPSLRVFLVSRRPRHSSPRAPYPRSPSSSPILHVPLVVGYALPSSHYLVSPQRISNAHISLLLATYTSASAPAPTPTQTTRGNAPPTSQTSRDRCVDVRATRAGHCTHFLHV